MKIISIVGARPQFIKLAPISRELKKHKNVVHKIIHTGQHYDEKMSGSFFEELEIPEPDYNLLVGSGTHAEQTGKALEGIEKILIEESPHHVIVFGDTNATLSGVLAASKIHIPISHIEAGLRSYNLKMPEEINRLIADRLSTYLFCPNEESIRNLAKEGVHQGVFNVGDVMVDQIEYIKKLSGKDIPKQPYIFMTLHRQETGNSLNMLNPIFLELNKISEKIPIVFPAHPRIKKLIESSHIQFSENFNLVDPLGYLDSINFIKNAECIITDSGGIQKEAYILKIPCITLRTETEWTDTLQEGWNTLVFFNLEKFREAFRLALGFDRKKPQINFYGDGHASEKIIRKILNS